MQGRHPGQANDQARVSRRRFLKASATAAGTISLGIRAAAAQTPPTIDLNGSSLRILQWRHVIPDYITWLGQFATAWGQQHGVAVTIDVVDAATIPNALKTELARGSGHDLIEHIAPLPMFAPSLADLTDLVAEATRRHGMQQDFCRQDSLDPERGRFYGFAHGYAPTAINYRPKLWEAVQLAGGPSAWDELARGGAGIWTGQGVALGIGMSGELDSNTAAMTALWAHGATVQDASGAVTINSPEAIQAVTLFRQLYETCLTPGVFGWDILGNNQLLIDGQASAILNALSAFRSIQVRNTDLAADLMLRAPLAGPAGANWAVAPAHARFISMIPAFAPNRAAAQEFLLALVASYAQVATASKLYNFPAFASTVPGLKENGGPLDYDANFPDQGNRLSALKESNRWTVQLGWPGPTTPLIASAINESVLAQMMARSARREVSPAEAVREAESRLNAIAARQGA